MGFYQPAQLVRDAREHGVKVRAVDVNVSAWDCALEEATEAIRQLGNEAIREEAEAIGQLGNEAIREEGGGNTAENLNASLPQCPIASHVVPGPIRARIEHEFKLIEELRHSLR